MYVGLFAVALAYATISAHAITVKFITDGSTAPFSEYMMNSGLETINVLAQRLPELLWQLKRLYPDLTATVLPPGLFRQTFYQTPDLCIDEIKQDIAILKQQSNHRSHQFLADKISRKINVLVRLCHWKEKHPSKKATVSQGVRGMMSRQQWLQTLENDIHSLEEQCHALELRLTYVQQAGEPQAILALQGELGEARRELTVAKELWKKSTRQVL